MDVINFINNMESIFDDLVKRNNCYKLDAKDLYMVEAGGSSKVGKSASINTLKRGNKKNLR